mmetsp:Transcript_28310/g.92418  ORF Transcript_28310/g.92418 Transcript_28310/m.92418 type:complete len:267 (-) Transcript_28310:316-1116(-)
MVASSARIATTTTSSPSSQALTVWKIIPGSASHHLTSDGWPKRGRMPNRRRFPFSKAMMASPSKRRSGLRFRGTSIRTVFVRVAPKSCIIVIASRPAISAVCDTRPSGLTTPTRANGACCKYAKKTSSFVTGSSFGCAVQPPAPNPPPKSCSPIVSSVCSSTSTGFEPSRRASTRPACLTTLVLADALDALPWSAPFTSASTTVIAGDVSMRGSHNARFAFFSFARPSVSTNLPRYVTSPPSKYTAWRNPSPSNQCERANPSTGTS